MRAKIVFVLLVFFSPLYAESPMFRQLMEGTLEQKTQAMYHLGYAKSRKPFWLYVKYLSFMPQERDEMSAIQCREAAADALGRIKDPRAAKYLLERWEVEKQPIVKRKIIFSLRNYRDEKIADVIRAGLKDEDERVVFESVVSSAFYKNESLSTDIKSFMDKTEDTALKAACAFSLIMLNYEVTDNAKFLRESLTNKNPEVRYWCAFFLGEADRVEAIRDLERALDIEYRYYVARQIDLAIIRLRFEIKANRDLREYNEHEHIIK
ncbi:MAG TPA: hypothetical protein P5123_03390 [Spirochaetota bacterium]|nr:hypothetical protein [Spirochaetota bacterium]